MAAVALKPRHVQEEYVVSKCFYKKSFYWIEVIFGNQSEEMLLFSLVCVSGRNTFGEWRYGGKFDKVYDLLIFLVYNLFTNSLKRIAIDSGVISLLEYMNILFGWLKRRS